MTISYRGGGPPKIVPQTEDIVWLDVPEIQPDEIIPPVPQPKSVPLSGNYLLRTQAGTYAFGLQELQVACQKVPNCPHPQYTLPNGSKVYRSLTFKENLEVRVNDYESKKPCARRLELWNTWLDSCCGIAYKAGSTKFKLSLQCPELITITPNFAQFFLPVNYAQIQGVELDSSRSQYNQSLTKATVLEHPGWLTLVEEDKTLLQTYADIVFAEKKNTTAMSFWVRQNPAQNELRAVCINNLDNYSSASGSNGLNDLARFLLVVAHR